jgi:hypothetical protein
MASTYEIIIAGESGPMIQAALAGFEVSAGPRGSVRFVGSVKDQADLHGALHRLHDLHAHLLQVRCLDP